MKDERIALLAREIESRYRGTRIELRPTSDEEDPAIRAFLWILDVPGEKLCEVEDFAIDRALDLYGDDPLPFHVTAASPETSAKYVPAPTGPERSQPRRRSARASCLVPWAPRARSRGPTPRRRRRGR